MYLSTQIRIIIIIILTIIIENHGEINQEEQFKTFFGKKSCSDQIASRWNSRRQPSKLAECTASSSFDYKGDNPSTDFIRFKSTIAMKDRSQNIAFVSNMNSIGLWK